MIFSHGDTTLSIDYSMWSVGFHRWPVRAIVNDTFYWGILSSICPFSYPAGEHRNGTMNNHAFGQVHGQTLANWRTIPHTYYMWSNWTDKHAQQMDNNAHTVCKCTNLMAFRLVFTFSWWKWDDKRFLNSLCVLFPFLAGELMTFCSFFFSW